MAFKFVVFAAFVAVARAGNFGYVASPAVAYASAPVAYASPVAKYAVPLTYAAPVAKAVVAEPSAPAHYDFGYSVSDPHTGDQKSQQESRRGDVVQGSYSLVDADGTKRTVEYSADAHNGFNAVVHKEEAHVAPVVAKVAAPVHYASSVPVAHYAAPVVAKYASAPVVAKYAAAPVVAKYAAAPVVAKYAVAAPVAYAAHAPAGVTYTQYAAAPTYAYSAPSYYHH